MQQLTQECLKQSNGPSRLIATKQIIESLLHGICNEMCVHTSLTAIHFVSPEPAKCECRPLSPSLTEGFCSSSVSVFPRVFLCLPALTRPELCASGYRTYHSGFFKTHHKCTTHGLQLLNNPDSSPSLTNLEDIASHMLLRFWRCFQLQHLFPTAGLSRYPSIRS